MKPYLLLSSFLIALWNLSPSAVEMCRERAIVALQSTWPAKERLRHYLDDRPWGSSPHTQVDRSLESCEQGRRLAQLEASYEWLLSEEHIQQELALLERCHHKENGESFQTFLHAKWAHLASRFTEALLSFPGEVIHRDPAAWTSTIWINVGQQDNRALHRELIAKNSPVLSQGALIGLVEYVGERHSRVRLLTDSGFVPAVRAVRGGLQNIELASLLNATLLRLRLHDELFVHQKEKEALLTKLETLVHALSEGISIQTELAKGELHGTSTALWHIRGPLLQGIGFNYDFSDAQGPARDLRTGRPVGVTDGPWTPLIQKGDLLVTSGLDGLFPPNLPVALVERVLPAKEGAHSYEIEAMPAAGDLRTLRSVFVLPALNE